MMTTTMMVQATTAPTAVTAEQSKMMILSSHEAKLIQWSDESDVATSPLRLRCRTQTWMSRKSRREKRVLRAISANCTFVDLIWRLVNKNGTVPEYTPYLQSRTNFQLGLLRLAKLIQGARTTNTQ